MICLKCGSEKDGFFGNCLNPLCSKPDVLTQVEKTWRELGIPYYKDKPEAPIICTCGMGTAKEHVHPCEFAGQPLGNIAKPEVPYCEWCKNSVHHYDGCPDKPEPPPAQASTFMTGYNYVPLTTGASLTEPPPAQAPGAREWHLAYSGEANGAWSIKRSPIPRNPQEYLVVVPKSEYERLERELAEFKEIAQDQLVQQRETSDLLTQARADLGKVYEEFTYTRDELLKSKADVACVLKDLSDARAELAIHKESRVRLEQWNDELVDKSAEANAENTALNLRIAGLVAAAQEVLTQFKFQGTSLDKLREALAKFGSKT